MILYANLKMSSKGIYFYLQITSGAANLDSDLSLEMCGNKSGCMTRPQGCAGDDCEVVLSHKSVSGGVRFRLTLRQDDMTSSFVALGISEDQSMVS